MQRVLVFGAQDDDQTLQDQIQNIRANRGRQTSTGSDDKDNETLRGHGAGNTRAIETC